MLNESIACVKKDQLLLGPVKVTFQRTLRIPEAGERDPRGGQDGGRCAR